MIDRSTGRPGLTLAALLGALVLVAAACTSGASTTAAPGVSTPPGGASAGAAGESTSAQAEIDPCVKLTKADVQPFFSVPVATQLPGPQAAGDTCEWRGNDGNGGIPTSLDVNVVTGQLATDSWSMATGPAGSVTMFSGVGDQAEHLPGIPDFISIKGQVLCKIWTTGYLHLAGKMEYQPGSIPDAAATQIAQQYGTLCNKIFGSGDQTPTMVASPAA